MIANGDGVIGPGHPDRPNLWHPRQPSKADCKKPGRPPAVEIASNVQLVSLRVDLWQRAHQLNEIGGADPVHCRKTADIALK
jgi:hypothetical protein